MNDLRSPKAKRKVTERLKEARMGDTQAQYDVGLMYANGTGVARSFEDALVWLESAAKKGHANAQYLVGSAYVNGAGTEKNALAAAQWLLKAADQGNAKALLKLLPVLEDRHGALAYQCSLRAADLGLPEAQFKMGDGYAQGRFLPQDAVQAAVWYRKSAQQGLAQAQVALAECFAAGRGLEQDMAQALAWFRAAALQGSAVAQMALERCDAAGQGRSGASPKPGRERRSTDARWQKFAETGSPNDAYHLGLMYMSGVCVEKNTKQAKRWLQIAAQQGHADAQLALARLYEPQEPQAAAAWYAQAAQQGHPEAQYAMGRLQRDGAYEEHSALHSLGWYLKGAEQAHPAALWSMAQLLQHGDGDAAFSCLEQAARLGVVPAQHALGQAYLEGGRVSQDFKRAAHWLQLAAEQGSADAQCALAGLYAAGQGVAQDMPQAVHWYSAAAAQQEPKAQWSLGRIFAAGGEGVAPNPRQASAWCKKAANAGYAPAQATMGLLSAKAKKYEQAVFWWAPSAAQGDPEAQFNLANAYRLGLGLERDLERAFGLMLQAADQGVAAAQARLGLMYATGEGVAADQIEATKWFLLASAGGDASAQANVERAQNLFGPAPLAEAHRRAKVWSGGR